jgi:2',3'-cyclic-nucleotide 2'-phosphodiesterase (5'-nucleotidase family)
MYNYQLMKMFTANYILAALLLLAACRPTRVPVVSKEDGKLEAVFVQVNDVYEIAPLSGGKYGGMARVATLKKQYLAKNNNTYLVMAGDFVSPSVYNSLKYEGQRVRGKQMIEAMNAAGTNLAVFGNHEFDITEQELQDRINESDFDWVASNTFQKKPAGHKPFLKVKNSVTTPIPEEYIFEARDADGTTARIGVIGITLPFNKAEYVSYTDPFEAAEKVYNRLRDKCDAVVALTHQLMEDDIALAKRLPGLAAIIGGHEHDMRFEKVGNVYITKAHANAKSAYIVKLKINKNDKTVDVDTELKELDNRIPFDNATNAVVNKWIEIADKNFASIGFNARNVVMNRGDVLDGRESEIRHHPTNLSRLVVDAVAAASPTSDVVIFNTGSIRIDDFIAPPITEYDIIRALPFGGGLREVEMKGTLLIRILDVGTKKNIGIGGYLVHRPATFDSTTNKWMLNNVPLDPTKTYKVVMPDFLLSGKETNLDFINVNNPEMVKVHNAVTTLGDPRSDVRLAIIRYLQNKK